MKSKIKSYVKFYKPGETRVYTFKVNNEMDARKALSRFGVKFGYFHQINGKKTFNKKIQSN